MPYHSEGDLRALLDRFDERERELLHRLTGGGKPDNGAPKGVYRCQHCHSLSVQVAEMINPNTRQIMDECDTLYQDLKYAAEQFHAWCDVCETHRVLEWSSDGERFE